MRTLILCTALVLNCLLTYAQPANYIKGKVVQATDGQPVAGASVFVSNSTRGTVSNADGTFELTEVPIGNHEVVISSIGFVTLVVAYTPADLPLVLDVRMTPKASVLDPVTVEPDEKDGWEKWGGFFMQNFVGTTANAADCTLKNPEVLRFKYSKKKGTLVVIADAPLQIENRALGYNLQYQLEEFRYDFNTRYITFLGYSLFEDIATNRQNQQKRWAARRETAYKGSIQHFMKSLYHNQLMENGFEVRRLIKTPNLEKERVRAAMQARVRKQVEEKGQRVAISLGDSSDYYGRILRQPNEFETVLPALLTADSLLTVADSLHKRLFFPQHLSIIYKKEKEEKEYLAYLRENRPLYHQRSVMFLLDATPLLIDGHGNYSPVLGFISYGYWSWSEKIASMLPVDYEPGGD
jgi:hypothetical protein